MRDDIKLVYIFTAFCLSALFFGIRFKKLWVIVPAVIFLFGMTAVTRHPAPLAAVAMGMIFLYPGPQLGHLYGRDSHSAALIAQLIQVGKWPIPADTMLAWGFSQTPLLHIHTAILGTITGLSIVPSISGQPLISQYLPLIYLSFALLLSYLIGRKVANTPSTAVLGVLLVLFWTPMFEFRSGFRRSTIVLPIFATVVLILAIERFSNHRRVAIVVPLCSLAIVLGHHLTAILFMLFGAGAFMAGNYKSTLGRNLQRSSVTLLVVTGFFFLVWNVVAGYGAEPLSIVVLSSLNITADVPTPVQVTNGGIVDFLTNVAYPWLFCALIGGGLISGLYLKREVPKNRITVAITLFGVLLAPVAFVAWQTFPINYTRMLTYFVVIAAPVAVVLILEQMQEFHIQTRWVVIFFFCLLMIPAAVTVSPHIVSDSPPAYERGETSQRFSDSLYATADFADRYVYSRMVGAGNVQEVVIPLSQTQVSTGYAAVTNRSVPDGAVVALQAHNSKIYKGPYGSGWAYLRLPGVKESYDSNSHRIYSNGNMTLFG